MSSGDVVFGTISFFVNDPKDEPVSDEEMAALGRLIAERYTARLNDSPLRGVIVVQGFEARRGCIIVSLHLAAVVAAASTTVLAVKGFLEKYKDIREGAILLAKDLNNLRVKLNSWSKEHAVWFYNDDLEYQKAKKRLEERARQIGKGDEDG
jgi:hypothetical protein